MKNTYEDFTKCIECKKKYLFWEVDKCKKCGSTNFVEFIYIWKSRYNIYIRSVKLDKGVFITKLTAEQLFPNKTDYVQGTTKKNC